MLGRGPQIFLDGEAALAARGGIGTTMRENIDAMELLFAAGIVGDGYSEDGKSRTGVEPEDYLLGVGEALTTLNGLSKTTLSDQTVVSTVDFGIGQTNFLRLQGAAANPTLSVQGTGNGALILRGLGTGGINLGSSTSGNIVQMLAAATNGGTLTIAQPAASTTAINLGTVSNTAGINFNNIPVLFTRNWTYSGLATDVGNSQVAGSSTIGGTSANTAQYSFNRMLQTLTNYHTSQGLRGWEFAMRVGSGTQARTAQAMTVTISQSSQPLKSTDVAWVGSTSYATLGTPVVNGPYLYQLRTVGTSASSGGPTGTGSSISDGSCVWSWEDLAANTQTTIGWDVQALCSFNVGGVSGAPVGSNWGMLIAARLNSAATFYNQNIALEIDERIDGSANRAATVQLVRTGTGQGTVQDWGIAFGGAGTWRNNIIFQSAVDATNGYAFAFEDQSTPQLQTMAGVLDMRLVTPTGAGTTSLFSSGGGFFFRGSNWQLLSSGALQMRYGSIVPTNSGLTIDADYKELTAVAFSSGGAAGWVDGGWARDQYGNVVNVTATAGAVTGISSIQVKGHVTGSAPATSTFRPMGASTGLISATGSSVIGNTFVATLTYAAPATPAINVGTGAAAAVNIGRSGQALGFYGAAAVAKPTGVAVDAAGIHAALVSLGLIAA